MNANANANANGKAKPIQPILDKHNILNTQNNIKNANRIGNNNTKHVMVIGNNRSSNGNNGLNINGKGINESVINMDTDADVKTIKTVTL